MGPWRAACAIHYAAAVADSAFRGRASLTPAIMCNLFTYGPRAGHPHTTAAIKLQASETREERPKGRGRKARRAQEGGAYCGVLRRGRSASRTLHRTAPPTATVKHPSLARIETARPRTITAASCTLRRDARAAATTRHARSIGQIRAGGPSSPPWPRRTASTRRRSTRSRTDRTSETLG